MLKDLSRRNILAAASAGRST